MLEIFSSPLRTSPAATPNVRYQVTVCVTSQVLEQSAINEIGGVGRHRREQPHRQHDVMM